MVFATPRCYFIFLPIIKINDSLGEVNSSLGNMEFQISGNKPQWREVGADTWNFFSSDLTATKKFISTDNNKKSYTFTATGDCYLVVTVVRANYGETHTITKSSGAIALYSKQYSPNNTQVTVVAIYKLAKGDSVTASYTSSSAAYGHGSISFVTLS